MTTIHPAENLDHPPSAGLVGDSSPGTPSLQTVVASAVDLPPIDGNEALNGERGSAAPPPDKPPGPGLWEAIAWCIGLLLVHAIGAFLSLVAVVTHQIVSSGVAPVDQLRIQSLLESVVEDHNFLIIGGEMAFFACTAVVLAWLRIGRPASRRLGVRPIPVAQTLLLLATIIPVAQFCTGLHVWLDGGWELLLQSYPALNVLDSTNTLDMLQDLRDAAPLGVLVLVIAVAPAVGEEIVFRGVIGRGLTARYGAVAGVLLTSLLFAAFHVHPTHALAVLPLGVYIHLVYLATRSFLAPMLVHFCNNALAAVALTATAQLEGTSLDEEASVPIPMMVISFSIAMLTLVALWKTRTRYILADGTEWKAGYSTVEPPPDSAGAMEMPQPAGNRLLAAALFTSVGFSTLFLLAMMLTIGQ